MTQAAGQMGQNTAPLVLMDWQLWPLGSVALAWMLEFGLLWLEAGALGVSSKRTCEQKTLDGDAPGGICVWTTITWPWLIRTCEISLWSLVGPCWNR